MDFKDLVHARYSCRKFSDRPVEKEKLDVILDAGLFAPSAINCQPVHVWIVQDESRRTEMKKACKFLFGAPCILVVGFDPELQWIRKYDDKAEGEVDSVVFATSMMMQIADIGLGSTYVGDFDPAVMKQILPETEGYELVCLLPCGYPSVDAKPSAKHTDRKPKEERE